MAPKIAMIFDMPSGADVREQAPLSGEDGAAWEKMFITDLGYRREDVLMSHVLRCRQKNDKFGHPLYPKEPMRKRGELNCRHYDLRLNEFDPNLYVISLHPRSIRLIGAHARQIARDVNKAFTFAGQGYRPAVLLGEPAAELYFPWMKAGGGLKNWRGHYWQGESPFLPTSRRVERKFPQGD